MDEQRWKPPVWLDRSASVSWRLLAVGGVLAAVIFVLSALSSVVGPLLLGIVICGGIWPLNVRLRRAGLSRGLAAIATTATLVAAFLGLLLTVGLVLAGQLGDISDAVSEGADELQRWLQEGPAGMEPEDAQRLRDAAASVIRSVGTLVTQGLMSLGSAAIAVASTAIITVLVIVFLLMDGDRAWLWLRGLVAPAQHALADRIGERAWRAVSGYAVGVTIVAVFDGVMATVGLLLLGVPLAGALGVLTFSLAFFPMVGAITAGAVATLVALADGGWAPAIAVIVLYLVINQSESVLQTFVVGRAVRLHPLVILLSLTAGFAVAGLLGGLLAAPVVAVISATMSELRAAGSFSEQIAPHTASAGE